MAAIANVVRVLGENMMSPRLTALGEATIDDYLGRYIDCDDCVIGGYNSFPSTQSRGYFYWLEGATDEAAAARNAYFDQYC